MHISDYFTAAELQEFNTSSDVLAMLQVVSSWLLIWASFLVVYWMPNLITVLLALFVIGGRQLGLAVLMHDAGHRSLFASKRLNEIVGQWLCAYPVFAELETYATSHRRHHAQAGSEDDPDLPNYRSYPVERASFKRKIIRDLTGQTGYKAIQGLIQQGSDITVQTGAGRSRNHTVNALLVNLGLWLLLSVFLSGWLYLLWFGAWLTTFTFWSRIRQVAEHGAVSDLYDPDPRKHTRTTLVNRLERVFLSPHYVNYHCEHHFAPTVPCYRLRDFHLALVKKGFYREHTSALSHGYAQVIKNAVG